MEVIPDQEQQRRRKPENKKQVSSLFAKTAQRQSPDIPTKQFKARSEEIRKAGRMLLNRSQQEQMLSLPYYPPTEPLACFLHHIFQTSLLSRCII
ncbi:hypothetical protein JD844_025600 [Phrynosoma platyrhinos]|uniref:Uncharacterized protein n=1 Tax=Phrynosoma platyrhinos TaxID=52577 RepID=A0ABQ7SZU1_PHRPL|nr:hypothetical protein JD844_025600 [Phrynosoma platyrhinos]